MRVGTGRHAGRSGADGPTQGQMLTRDPKRTRLSCCHAGKYGAPSRRFRAQVICPRTTRGRGDGRRYDKPPGRDALIVFGCQRGYGGYPVGCVAGWERGANDGFGGAPRRSLDRAAGGHTYWVAPEAFFQANTSAAELLVGEVGEQLPRKIGTLLDAHAGVGTFALSFANRAKRVIGFEVDNSAVGSARWSARANNISNAEFRHGRAEALMRALAESDKPDVVWY